MAAFNSNKELFSTPVSNIKTYRDNDPLRPWLQGIRKMKKSLPSHVLMEKLPRFLQKCAQTFESDRRYRNDFRYIRIWIQLGQHNLRDLLSRDLMLALIPIRFLEG